MPLDEAYIPVLDRGFIFGDGVYEVIPAYGNRLFRLEHHLNRLEQSLVGIRLANPLSRSLWADTLNELLNRNTDGSGPRDQSVYLQVTRGVAKRDHAFPQGVPATVFAMANPLAPSAPTLRDQGIKAITRRDTRWDYCQIKAITLLPNILLRQEAIDEGCAEAILVRDGEVTEGAASNLFIVLDGSLITPPNSPRVLPGITRDLILELAAAHGLAHQERMISEDDLRRADEVWLTSSTKEILPVTELDGRPVGDGKPGSVWARMMALYQNYKESLRSGTYKTNA